MSAAFLLAEGFLWLTFLAGDLQYLDTTWIKYGSICLCALAALTRAGGRDGRLVLCAQLLTLCADWFLLVRNDRYLLGLGFFLAVQGVYWLRLRALGGRRCPPWSLPLRCAALAACAGALALGGQPLVWVPGLYFLNLVLNALEALVLDRRVFAAGLILFVCCDLCVGGWNLGLLPGLTRVGMWFFYLPSQVLIVLSVPVADHSSKHKGE